MTKEELEQRLIEKCEEENINFLRLSFKLAEEYIKYFSLFRIRQLITNKSDTFEIIRLNLSSSIFNEEEKEILQFSDEYHINLSANSSVTINLKGYIIKIIWDGKSVQFNQAITANDLLIYINKNKEEEYKEWLQNFQNKLYLKSLVYAYTYGILLESARENIDYVRAGMFKNAYFDIIEYQNNISGIYCKR